LNRLIRFAGVYPDEGYPEDAYDAASEEDDRQNAAYGTYGAYGGNGGGSNVINPGFGRGAVGAGSASGQQAGSGASNVVNMHGLKNDNNYVLASARPEHYEEAQEICDHLRERHVVIINLEKMDSELAQRTVDFISGAVYALDGEIIKFSRNLIGIAPSNVNLVTMSNESKGKGFLPFMNSAYKN
jgi:cell division inhibitor SepF